MRKKTFFLTICLIFSLTITYGQEIAVDEVRLVFDQENIISRQVSLDISPSGRYMAFAFENGTIKVFDTQVNRYISSKYYAISNLFEIRFTKNEERLILVEESQWKVLNWKKKEVVFQKALKGKPSRIAIGKVKDWVAIGMMDAYVDVFDLSSFTEVYSFRINTGHHVGALDFSYDDKYLMAYGKGALNSAFGNGDACNIYDLESRSLVKYMKKNKNPINLMVANFSQDEYAVYYYNYMGAIIGKWDFMSGQHTVLKKMKIKEFKDFLAPTNYTQHDDRFINSGNAVGYSVWKNTGELVFTTRRTSKGNEKSEHSGWAWGVGVDVQSVKRIKDTNKYIINPYGDNVNHIFDIDKNAIIGYFYTDANDEFAVVARDGRVDGTSQTFSKLAWSERKSDKRLPLDVNLSQNITPRLYANLVYGQSDNSAATLMDAIEMAPSITITSPDSISSTSSRNVEITYTTQANGDPIKDVITSVNGKSMEQGTRGFRKVGKTVSVSLVPGKNIIQLTAVSEKGYQSVADQIIITYNGEPAKSELYLLSIGVNQYKNPRYNLNYADADATAFNATITGGGQSIFEDVKQFYIKDSDATKQNIENTFNEIAQLIGPEDVFVFYYAGHGVMSEDDSPLFYIIPHEVTQLYGDNETMGGKAISANQLKEYSSLIAAQKQLFVLDACQSGGMTEMLAMRGAAEERAIAQLARSTGTYWLTASGSEQFATEFKALGHGLFTYTIIEGLSGKADGGSMDGKITVKELSAYLNDRVPELSEQHKGQAQYPTSYGFGQDFPIVIVE